MATARKVLAPSWETVDDTDWLLKPLTGLEMEEVREGITVNDDGSVTVGAKGCRAALYHGLKGWRNFPDESGAEEPFSTAQLQNLDRVPFELVQTLVTLILARSYLGDDDAKKS